METYKAVVVLYVAEFVAENKDDADRIVNEYLDALGDVAPMSLTWPEVNYEIQACDTPHTPLS